MDTNNILLGGGVTIPCNGLASHPGGKGGVAISSVASYYRNRVKLWPLWASLAHVRLYFYKVIAKESVDETPV